MPVHRRRRVRSYLIAGLSLLLHVIVLGWMARPGAPDLSGAGSGPALLSVEIVTPATPDSRRPTSSSRRSSGRAADRIGAPRPAVLETPFPGSPSVTVAVADHGATSPEGSVATDNLRAALRASTGCADATFPSLSVQEREKCREKLGRLGASAPSYDAPMDPEKRAYFDRVIAAGPSGGVSRDPTPGGVTPGSAYVPFLKCSVVFGVGRKPKDNQGTVRLGRTPCAVPLQGSFFTPEATVERR
jgi:hypothetical protein